MALTREKANSIARAAAKLGISARDLATVISYETAGTFDPWKAGPTTQWGQHRGLIQWGEVQRQEYGVTKDMSFDQQMDAVVRYMQANGVRPGMGLLDVYSAVNAGEVGLYNATDANNGGAPGTVRDKVENQMAGHAAKADQLLAMASPDIQTQIAQADIPTPTEAPRGRGLDGILASMFPTPTARGQAQNAVDYMAAGPAQSDPNAIHNQPWYEPTVNETIAQRVFSDWFSQPSAAAQGVISAAKQRDAFVPLTTPGPTMVPDSFYSTGTPSSQFSAMPLVNASASDPAPTLQPFYNGVVPDDVGAKLMERATNFEPGSPLPRPLTSVPEAPIQQNPQVAQAVAANPESYLPGEMQLADFANMPSMPSYAMAPAVQPPVQFLAPPKQVKQYNVAEPQAPAPPPVPSGMDVWQGQSSYGMATDGSTLSRNPDGSVSRYSEKYDRWDTYNPQTDQWLPGGGQTGNLSLNLPSKNRLIDGGKNMAGSAAGGLLGSYLGGPIGGLLGAALGKSVAQGKGLGGLLGGGKTTVFPAAPGSGLTGPFPSRPNAPRGGGTSRNYSDDDISRAESLSPSLADAMRSGVGGLW